MTRGASIHPVSYTHLDVYKRQVIAGALTYFAVLFMRKDQFFISNIKNIASKVISRGRHEV